MRTGGKIRAKAETTWMKTLGVNSPGKSSVVEAKRTATCLNRYGAKSPMQVEQFKERRRRNTLAKYGVENTSQLSIVIDKMHATNIARYGAKSPLKNPDVYAKVDWALAVKRNHESMKRNNSFRKSNAEDKMYELLVERFGVEDVERQAKPSMTNWPIDLYVKSIDVWIQVDGVYWHGLDQPLEEHIKLATPRSISIVGKWYVDREQERWFNEHCMKLVRITDTCVNSLRELPNDISTIAYAKTY